MKDLAHHLKKVNRKILRSIHKEELENESFANSSPAEPNRKQTPREAKKIKKRAALRARKERVPSKLTAEERNKKMKKRVPIFDKNNAKPRHAKASKKKTPQI